MDFNRVTEHLERKDKIRWNPEGSLTHRVGEDYTTICGIGIGNYENGWAWGEYMDSEYCNRCFGD